MGTSASRLPIRLLAIGPQDACPPIDGGKEGIHGALAALGSRLTVTYAHPASVAGVSGSEAYEAIGVVRIEVDHTPREDLANFLDACLRGRSYKFHKYSSGRAARALRTALGEREFDALLCFGAHSAALGERLRLRRGRRLPLLLREHNLEYEVVRFHRESLGPIVGLAALPFEWLALREERRLWQRMDAVAFLDSRDFALARATGVQGRFLLAPEGVPLPPRRRVTPPERPGSLLLPLNPRAPQSVHNLGRFLREYWLPAAREPALAGVVLAITGVDLEALAKLVAVPAETLERARVRPTGFLPDLAPTFASSLAVVSPAFRGAGLRKKLLEGMAQQVPVLASDLDLETNEWLVPGENVVRLGDPTTFVREVERLGREPETWQRIAEAGRDTVERHASWDRFGDVMTAEIARLVEESRSSAARA